MLTINGLLVFSSTEALKQKIIERARKEEGAEQCSK